MSPEKEDPQPLRTAWSRALTPESKDVSPHASSQAGVYLSAQLDPKVTWQCHPPVILAGSLLPAAGGADCPAAPAPAERGSQPAARSDKVKLGLNCLQASSSSKSQFVPVPPKSYSSLSLQWIAQHSLGDHCS